jgi:hypothetical protein
MLCVQQQQNAINEQYNDNDNNNDDILLELDDLPDEVLFYMICNFFDFPQTVAFSACSVRTNWLCECDTVWTLLYERTFNEPLPAAKQLISEREHEARIAQSLRRRQPLAFGRRRRSPNVMLYSHRFRNLQEAHDVIFRRPAYRYNHGDDDDEREDEEAVAQRRLATYKRDAETHVARQSLRAKRALIERYCVEREELAWQHGEPLLRTFGFLVLRSMAKK